MTVIGWWRVMIGVALLWGVSVALAIAPRGEVVAISYIDRGLDGTRPAALRALDPARGLVVTLPTPPDRGLVTYAWSADGRLAVLTRTFDEFVRDIHTVYVWEDGGWATAQEIAERGRFVNQPMLAWGGDTPFYSDGTNVLYIADVVAGTVERRELPSVIYFEVDDLSTLADGSLVTSGVLTDGTRGLMQIDPITWGAAPFEGETLPCAVPGALGVSPDGVQVAYNCGGNDDRLTLVVASGTSDGQRLTVDFQREIQQAPRFSPDGTRLLLYRSLSGENTQSGYAVLDVATGDVLGRNLLGRNNFYSNADWVPPGALDVR